MYKKMQDRSIELEQEVGSDAEAYAMTDTEAKELMDDFDDMPLDEDLPLDGGDECPDCGTTLDLDGLCPLCDTAEFSMWEDLQTQYDDDDCTPIVRKMRRDDE